MSRIKFSVEESELIEEISSFISPDGTLETNLIFKNAEFKTEEVISILDKMTKTQPVLARKSNGLFVFDFDQSEVIKALHFRNAMSNIGLMNEDFF